MVTPPPPLKRSLVPVHARGGGVPLRHLQPGMQRHRRRKHQLRTLARPPGGVWMGEGGGGEDRHSLGRGAQHHPPPFTPTISPWALLWNWGCYETTLTPFITNGWLFL